MKKIKKVDIKETIVTCVYLKCKKKKYIFFGKEYTIEDFNNDINFKSIDKLPIGILKTDKPYVVHKIIKDTYDLDIEVNASSRLAEIAHIVYKKILKRDKR